MLSLSPALILIFLSFEANPITIVANNMRMCVCASVYDGKVCPHTFWLLGFLGPHTLYYNDKNLVRFHMI